MNKLIKVVLINVLIATVVCLAHDHVISRVSVRKHPAYAQLQTAMRELVAQDGKSGENTFYACQVEQFSNNYHHAWIYWKEGNAIILAEPDLGGYEGKYLLVWSRRYLHLDKDVVPALNDVKGSSYLVTRKWAHTIVEDCVSHGDKFIFNKALGSL